jgi:trk system potassium uptake protein TrkA
MAKKQFIIIGLGNTGIFLANHLTSLGSEVLAVDNTPEKVQDITPNVAQAVVADSTRKQQLAALPVTKVDAVICCIGADLEASLLTMLNLKELGVKHIIAKSSSSQHTSILERFGVSDIFQPERDMAISIAERLTHPNMLDRLPFLEGFSIIEILCPSKFIGKTLKELSLTSKYGIQIIAIRDPLQPQALIGNLADYLLKENDILFVLGPNEVLESFG